jgi:hypothetical protein
VREGDLLPGEVRAPVQGQHQRGEQRGEAGRGRAARLDVAAGPERGAQLEDQPRQERQPDELPEAQRRPAKARELPLDAGDGQREPERQDPGAE